MNTATAAAEKLGTSLEVLAPYLPYGIDCHYLLSTGKPMRRKLVGLDLEEDAVSLSNKTFLNFDEVLPVLRDFSQLTVPLPDGTIPAHEVLRLLEIPLHESEDAFINDDVLWVRHGGHVRGQWALHNFLKPGELSLKVATYLRSKHFAVGLEPHQFIEAAPSTPTREADNTATTIL